MHCDCTAIIGIKFCRFKKIVAHHLWNEKKIMTLNWVDWDGLRCGIIDMVQFTSLLLRRIFFIVNFLAHWKIRKIPWKGDHQPEPEQKKTSHLLIYMNGMGIYWNGIILITLHSLRTAKRTIIIAHSRKFTRLEHNYYFVLQHFFLFTKIQ